jgi:hypothetical protein
VYGELTPTVKVGAGLMTHVPDCDPTLPLAVPVTPAVVRTLDPKTVPELTPIEP